MTSTTEARASTDDAGATLVYDGECPFCSAYVSLVRLRDAVGPVRLVNARDGGPVVERVRARGYDLDEGMVLILDGRYHHGADGVHRIALLSTPSGAFNRLNRRLLGSATASRLLYPFLRAGRNATLALLGRRKMGRAPG